MCVYKVHLMYVCVVFDKATVLTQALEMLGDVCQVILNVREPPPIFILPNLLPTLLVIPSKTVTAVVSYDTFHRYLCSVEGVKALQLLYEGSLLCRHNGHFGLHTFSEGQ